MSLQVKQKVIRAIFDFLETKTWQDAQRIVEEQCGELLTDTADQVFGDLIIQTMGDTETTSVLYNRRALLTYCRQQGIESAFTVLQQSHEFSTLTTGALEGLRVFPEEPALIDLQREERISALTMLLESQSTDEMLQILYNCPIILTDKAIHTLEGSLPLLQSVANDGANADIQRAQECFAFIQRIRELGNSIKDSNLDPLSTTTGPRFFQRIIQELVLRLTSLSMKEDASPKELSQLLEKYGDILQTTLIERYFNQLIATVEQKFNSSQSVICCYQSHQEILRYLRQKSSSHPILSLIHQCLVDRQLPESIEALVQEQTIRESADLRFMWILRLYVPYICRERLAVKGAILYLFFLCARNLEHIKLRQLSISDLIEYFCTAPDPFEAASLLKKALSLLDGESLPYPYNADLLRINAL